MCFKRSKRQEERHVSTGPERRAKPMSVPVGGQRKIDFGRRSFKFSDTASSSAPAGGKSARKLPPRPGEVPCADEAPDPSDVLNFSHTKP